LRRSPPCFTVNDDPVIAANILVNQKLAELRKAPTVLATA